MEWSMVYYVYVIRLDNSVLQLRKFRLQNPKIDPTLPCFYIGQSCHHPETRFWQHKRGYKANRYARKFGLGLCPQYYECYNPITTRKQAEEIEEKLTSSLRIKGHGVWSN